jgi:DNA-binding beta-propeller fold protein YncE
VAGPDGLGRVVHLAEDGSELLHIDRIGGALSVNPSDGSCWVLTDTELVHLAEDGTELLRVPGLDLQYLGSVSVNPTDGSCWVAVRGQDEVVHFAEDGSELVRVGGLGGARSVSVNPTDGSCRVVAGELIHLAADGTELWRRGGFDYPTEVSVNPTDGSCWVTEWSAGRVAHIASDGTELWRGGDLFEPGHVAVNSADGSCWVAQGGISPPCQVTHVAEDGSELWRGGEFDYPSSVSVNPTDGSCWVANHNPGEIVHLVIPGWQPSVFYDVPWYFWAFEEVGACVEAGVVSGYGDGLYHPERQVTRGQMAVFVARGLAEGDEGIPDFTGTPTFPDVDAEHWALDYVQYVVEQNVVGGYLDGTYRPTNEVTRDQMAVYVARSMVAPTTAVLDDYVPADPRNFPDVGTDHWAYTYVEYCVEQGVVGGFLDGTYRPTVVVTRDQMAVYVARAFGLLS